MELSASAPEDEAFLLDLLNTTPVIDGVPTDHLDGDWMTAHNLRATADERAALAEARSAIQGVIRGDLKPTALQPLLAGVRLSPTTGDDGVDWQLAGVDAAARAVLAWDGLRVNSPGRLRPCANTECQLFLIDRSKPNTARWCSMAICGNRMKARRHYQRSRS